MKQLHNLVYIIYDGIDNPVFEGQVVAPLLKKIANNPGITIHLISLETTPPCIKWLNNFNAAHGKNLSLHIIPRTRYTGLWNLYAPLQKVKTFLKTLDTYTVIARGPLAGYIAQKSVTESCLDLTIQVRGLLAEEYRFAHRSAVFPFSLVHALRKHQYHTLEKKVFTRACHLETVTQALKTYLCTTYALNPDVITIAYDDIPTLIEPQKKDLYRARLRTYLGIKETTYVYVYNGSAKPWQCPHQTVDLFCTEYAKNQNTYLLILTRDVADFKKILIHSELPLQTYSIHSVTHTSISEYLCAADEGLLLREHDIVNWVSRPTKFLEYLAVGLPVRHNNTIHLLIEHKKSRP